MTDHTDIGGRAIGWAIGMSIAHVTFGLSGAWGPIGGLFIIGIYYLARGALE